MSKMGQKKKPSNEELIEFVQKQATELGRTPLLREFKYKTLISGRYGTWSKFLSAAGLKPAERKGSTKQISREELIELIQELAAELGRIPQDDEFEYSHSAKSTYGSWTYFLEHAGLDPEQFQARKEPISNEELLELVQERAEELGHKPTRKEFNYYRLAAKRFGTWSKFLERAELTKKNKVKKTSLTNEELIELVKKRAAKLGRTPKMNEFSHGSIAVSRYSSWKKFLQSAGLNKEPSTEELIALMRKQTSELGKEPTLKQFEHGSLVLKRFGTWKKFLEIAGSQAQTKNLISSEHLIELVKEKASELGYTPFQREFKYGTLAASRFGSWTQFLESAGLEVPNREQENSLSNKELIKLVRKQAAELDRNPRKKDFEHGKLATKRFGTWNEFLQSADLIPKQLQAHESFRSWLSKESKRKSKDK